MKENSIEELKQRLEELYKTQQARLDVGADDLDIREAIAEVEEEIKELQDDTNVDRENSIKNERSSMEETIKTIEKMIKSYKEADKCGLSNNDFKNEIKALEHILSDYKRILKENEILNEEKEQAWEEWNSLEQGSYETEQKLKQQIKKLQKENEELKIIKSAIQTLQINSLEEEKYIVISKGSFLGGNYKHLLDDYIPIQKVKDKIEELKAQYKTALEENSTEAFILKCQITILQELIEEREEK